MTQRIGNPLPFFLDRRGRPLTGGSVYLGEAGEDPELSPVAAFFDSEMELGATQPIRTIGGHLVNNGLPTFIYVDAVDYSLRVRDADGAEVFYTANAQLSATLYQPLDTDLTAIAALATTAFGRTVLTMANAAALRQHAGIVDSLPLTGGAMTGVITRQSGGAHLYFVDAAYSTGRVYVTANGADDPRADPSKDIWLEEEPV